MLFVIYNTSLIRLVPSKESRALLVGLILKGLSVPTVSFPPTSILRWNSADKNFVPLVFDFGSSLFYDDGTLLLFYKDDLQLRAILEALQRPTTSPS